MLLAEHLTAVELLEKDITDVKRLCEESLLAKDEESKSALTARADKFKSILAIREDELEVLVKEHEAEIAILVIEREALEAKCAADLTAQQTVLEAKLADVEQLHTKQITDLTAETNEVIGNLIHTHETAMAEMVVNVAELRAEHKQQMEIAEADRRVEEKVMEYYIFFLVLCGCDCSSIYYKCCYCFNMS